MQVSSDGFWIDEEQPKGGYVVDGPDPTVDELVTKDRFEFSVSWGAFFGMGEEAGLEGLSYLVGFDECSKPPEEVYLVDVGKTTAHSAAARFTPAFHL